ncbi:hypothetical protein ACWEPC_02670 [Nonomuraea sp. NPDC004297]
MSALLLGGGGLGAYAYLNSPGPAPAVARPSEPPPSAAPEPSATPDDTQAASRHSQPGTPITHTEFRDWSFAEGGIKFQADKVAGWTYGSCGPVDGQGVLADNKCRRAVQLVYSAYRGHLKAVQLMLAFPSDRAAKATADRLSRLTSTAVRWRRDKALPDYAYGKILSGASKKYVIVTIVTADRSADPMAPNFHAYLQSDQTDYFERRDLTITS